MSQTRPNESLQPANDAKTRWFVVLLLCPLLLLFVALTTPRVPFSGGFDSDGLHYAAMAGAQVPLAGARLEAPFAWRVLTPFLGSLLPGPYLWRFRLLGVLANWATLALLFETLRAMGRTTRASVVGVLLYAGVFWTLKFSWYSPFYIDAETQCFVALLVWLSVRRRYGWVLAVLPLAALQKESAVVGALLAIAYHGRAHGWRSAQTARYVALALLASVVPQVIVRFVVGPLPQLWSLQRAFAVLLAQPSLPAKLALSTVSGLGILALLLPVYARQAWHFLRTQPEWGLLTAVTLLLTLGGVDKSRLFLYALLPLTVLAVHVIDAVHVQRQALPENAWIIMTLSVHAWLGWHLTPMGDGRAYLLRMVPEWGAAAGWPPVAYYTQMAVILGLWLVATAALAWRRARQSA